MFGTVPEPEDIANPSINDLLEKVDSKYVLSVYTAQYTRQINSYRQEMMRGDGNITTLSPLVEASLEDKLLLMALEKIREDKVERTTEKD